MLASVAFQRRWLNIQASRRCPAARRHHAPRHRHKERRQETQHPRHPREPRRAVQAARLGKAECAAEAGQLEAGAVLSGRSLREADGGACRRDVAIDTGYGKDGVSRVVCRISAEMARQQLSAACSLHTQKPLGFSRSVNRVNLGTFAGGDIGRERQASLEG